MIKYFFKYYIYNGASKFIRSSFILPLLTIIIGCFVMMMSFSIMEGFSNEVSKTIYFFDKEHSITINKKIFFNKNSKNDLDSLIYFLIQKKYFFNAYEDRVMFIDNNIHKTTARVYGVTNFDSFKAIPFLLNPDTSINKKYLSDCYLGYNQSINLNIESGEIINISSVLDFQNLNTFPSDYFHVKNVIKTNIPRYDDSVFIKFDSLLFSKNIFLNINLNKKINEDDLAVINATFDKGILYNKDNHLFSDLIYAINYEKLFYTFFGLFIILISSIMLMGFNISSIVRNISSIGLLEAIGFKKKYIIFSYFIYAIFIATLGFFISLFVFNILLFTDTNYHLMDYIFDPSIYFHFDLRLSNDVLIKIFLLDIVLISLSTLYPIYKISKLDIIDSIKNRV